ncbi:MAG TPA: tetratricopeptide repeat protein [Candidatus Brocadiia bacterium]|nr:tetratricopeptide repeat protein [Candidatus Brocadiales bacterium]
MQTTVSLCMIIRNEENFLSGCLESVKHLVNEMIIVDTGSTDGSVEIAKRYGAKIFHHRWNNDFSEARNHALQHAKGDWVLHLDADEELKKEDISLVKEIIKDKDTNGVQCVIYNVQKDSSDFLISYFFRLFRNNIGVSYSGLIHETPIIPGKLSHSNIRIIHYGYASSKEGLKDKCERNVRLLRKQLIDSPDDPFIHFHLAKTYYQLKTFDMALAEGEEVLRLMPITAFKTRPELEIFVLMACVQFNKGNFLDAERMCLEAIRINPNYLDPYFFLGHVYLKQGDFEKAILYYEKYQKKRKPFEEGLEFNCVGLHSLTRQHEVYFALGLIYEREKNYQKAIEKYFKALETNPRYAEAYNGLATAYFAQNEIDNAIIMLEKAISVKPNYAMAHKNLGVIYAKQNKFKLAAETFEKAIQIISGNQKTQKEYV